MWLVLLLGGVALSHWCQKIVDKSSAVLNLPDSRETQIALDADHKNMCKFASPDEENYKHVSANIVHLANSATKAFEERSPVEDMKTPETMTIVQEAEPSICESISELCGSTY